MPFKRFIFIGLLLFFAGQAQAAFVFSPEIQKGLEAAAAMRTGEAQRWLEQEQQKRPDNAMSLLLEDYMAFYQLIFTADPTAFARAEAGFDKRLSQLGKEHIDNEWAYFTKARMHFHRTILNGQVKNFFTAALQLNKASNAINSLEKKYPDFLLAKREAAVLNVVFGSVPEQYRWAASAVGWSGDEAAGIRDLKAVLPQFKGSALDCFHEESHVMLAYILGFSKDQHKAAWNLLLRDKMPQTNLTAIYMLGKLGPRTGQNEKAIELLSQRPQGKDYAQFPLFNYYLANAYLYKSDPRALTFFEVYLAGADKRIYRKDAVLRMSYYYFTQDKPAEARAVLGRMKAMEGLDEKDKQAEREAVSLLQQGPHVDLLRARLKYDGGYFKEALAVLLALQPAQLTFADQIEYYYRTARVWHDDGMPQKAIASYQACIERGTNDGNYLPANACLQLGMIYENSGNKKEAQRYYTRSLQFDKHPYSQSMGLKAKAGLHRTK